MRKDAEALYRVAYEEGQRLLDDQLDELSSMRTRGVQFLALVQTATAFLVGTSLHGADRDGAFYSVAIAGTLVSLITVALAVSLLLAYRLTRHPGIQEFRFRMWPGPLVAWIEPDVRVPEEADFLRRLAFKQQEMHRDNAGGLSLLRTVYVSLIVCGSLQLVVWGALAWAKG